MENENKNSILQIIMKVIIIATFTYFTANSIYYFFSVKLLSVLNLNDSAAVIDYSTRVFMIFEVVISAISLALNAVANVMIIIALIKNKYKLFTVSFLLLCTNAILVFCVQMSKMFIPDFGGMWTFLTVIGFVCILFNIFGYYMLFNSNSHFSAHSQKTLILFIVLLGVSALTINVLLPVLNASFVSNAFGSGNMLKISLQNICDPILRMISLLIYAIALYPVKKRRS